LLLSLGSLSDLLLLSQPLSNDLGVLGDLNLLLLSLSPLERPQVSTTLETFRSDKTLDLGGLGVRLGSFLLGDDLTTDNELANVIRLVEVEEATDLGSPLGTKSLGEDFVGKTGDVGLSLLDNDKVEGTNVGTDNATANGLALAFTGSAGSVARVTLGEEELDSVGNQDTLLERETLLVVSTGDPQDVSLELVSESIGRNLLGHTLLVEDASLALVIDLNGLLLPGGRVSKAQFHG